VSKGGTSSVAGARHYGRDFGAPPTLVFRDEGAGGSAVAGTGRNALGLVDAIALGAGNALFGNIPQIQNVGWRLRKRVFGLKGRSGGRHRWFGSDPFHGELPDSKVSRTD